MEILKLSEISDACGGSFSEEAEVNGICIDTRKITDGCLFICIKGERFDAHQFANEALEKGAAAVMISEYIEVNGPFVKVEDTAKAMLELSGYYRSKFNIPVVGLTGSVGKTTTKEMIGVVLSQKYKTAKKKKKNKKKNITNIGVSHIEYLGSREGILKAKLEILDGLADNAPLILNGDNDLLSTVKNDKHKIYFYGINCDADFKANNIEEINGSTVFTISYFGQKTKITIPLIGIHNVYNALAAFAVGYFLDVDADTAAEALSKYQPEGMRQKSVVINGITSIEDCYNASPDSMKAALQTLKATKGNKKIAVLSDMMELGDYSQKAHFEVGEMAAQYNVDYLLCVGEASKYIVDGAKSKNLKNAFLFESKDALTDKLFEIAHSGDVIVFKASRAMHLEDVFTQIYKRWES